MIIFVIKEIREEQDVSIMKLSLLTGISRTYLHNLEINKRTNPTIKNLLKIANALNVNIKSLFYSELDIDSLKKEMYERINKFGLDSKEVLEISHIIDLLNIIKMERL